jgi:RibD C-terminal domain
MSRLIVQMQTSADGYVEAADPAVRWQLWDWGPNWPWDDELKRAFNETFRAVDRILLSRKMVEDGYIDHWTRIAEGHPDERSTTPSLGRSATRRRSCSPLPKAVTYDGRAPDGQQAGLLRPSRASRQGRAPT